jgi:dolichol kinase
VLRAFTFAPKLTIASLGNREHKREYSQRVPFVFIIIIITTYYCFYRRFIIVVIAVSFDGAVVIRFTGTLSSRLSRR